MFVGTLPPVSNRASWKLLQEVVDDETGEPVDISTLTIKCDIRDMLDCDDVALSASTTNGKITIIDTGVFQVSFTEAEMAALHARTYKVGVTIADTDDTVQFIIGTVPVLNGVVSQ